MAAMVPGDVQGTGLRGNHSPIMSACSPVDVSTMYYAFLSVIFAHTAHLHAGSTAVRDGLCMPRMFVCIQICKHQNENNN